MTNLGRGSGVDGDAVLTSHNPTDSTCNGSSGTKTLNASNIAFAAGRYIKIRQERGGQYGKEEINKIESYNHATGVITTLSPLQNTYTDAGDDVAQVIVIPEYRGVTITAGFSIKAFNGVVGGHLCFFSTGRVINNSGVTVSGKGRGFRGGDRENSGTPPVNAEQGDSPVSAPTRSNSANGTGGGGAGDRNSGDGDTGGGAGHANVGNSVAIAGSDVTGDPGASLGTTDVATRFCMGGGGGGGIGPGGNDRGGFGGPGGATFDIFCQEFINNGTFDFSGNTGNTVSQYGSYNDGAGNASSEPGPGGSAGCGGGGGAAGAGQVTCNKFVNTGSILFDAGAGGPSNGGKATAGAGSVGVFRVRCCSYENTGTITGTTTTNIGGHDFCTTGGFIY